jgi:RNA polymerase sigma factor (sigma-70 family)
LSFADSLFGFPSGGSYKVTAVMTDDATLLHRYAQEGAPEALAELVHRYAGLVYSSALRRTNGDTAMAADVAQAVFTALARDARAASRGTVLIGWLYVATRNAALNALRAERRRKLHEQAAALSIVESNDPSASLPWEKLRPVIDRAMDALSADDRDAVLLRFFEKRSFAAIGATLETSEAAARMRVGRALEKLREQLSRAHITSTAVALEALLTNEALATTPAALADTLAAGALAAAGPAAGVTESFFYLMNTTKVAAAGAIAAVLAVGVALYESAQVSSLRRDLAAAISARRELQQQVARRSEPAPTGVSSPTPASTTANPTSIVPAIAVPTASTARVGSNVIQPSNPLGTLYALRGNPEAMEAWLNAERSALDLQFGALFRILRLTPEQEGQFKNVLMEKFHVVADITATAQAQGLTMSDPAIRAAFKDATDKAEESLKTLLGPDRYAQLREFGVTSEIREVVRNVAGDLASTAAPLDAQKTEQLIQIIAANSSQGSAGYKVDTTQWPAVLDAAATFLSPEQLTLLRAEAEQLALRRRLDQLAKPSK